MESIYEHPPYYDVLFGWDRDAEAAFYDEVFRQHGAPEGGRVLEVACGTGQIGVRLARLGWSLTGLDLSADMLAYLEARAHEAAVVVRTLPADMTDFDLEPAHCAAFNPMSSLRMLDEEQAVAHLNAIARALEPGAPYVLDLTFGPEELEVWTLERGGVEVRSEGDTIRVVDADRDVRLELDWGPRLRTLEIVEFERTVSRCPALSFAACYPEAGIVGEDDASLFDCAAPGPLPVRGRAMVVLARAA